MIRGIGIDLVEIQRVSSGYQRLGDKWVEKILSQEEKQRFLEISNFNKKIEFLASRFAAKEALMKALGEGMKIGFTHICVLNDEKGKPFFAYPQKEGVFHLSLTHTENYAAAFVIWEKP